MAKEERDKHPHPHSHPFHHTHDAEEYHKLIHRMSRIIGHANSIKGMLEEERDSSEVLIQISAVRSALNNLGKMILEDRIHHYMEDASATGDEEVRAQLLAELRRAMDRFIK